MPMMVVSMNVSFYSNNLKKNEIIPDWFSRCDQKKESKRSVDQIAWELLIEEIDRATRSETESSPPPITLSTDSSNSSSCQRSNLKLHYPTFVEPNEGLLRSAHCVLEKLLPVGDCESYHSVRVANQF